MQLNLYGQTVRTYTCSKCHWIGYEADLIMLVPDSRKPSVKGCGKCGSRKIRRLL